MNLADVIAELGQALSASGLTVTNTGAGDFPAVIISPPLAIRYNTTAGCNSEVDFRVSVLVSAQDEASALALIYRLFSYNGSGLVDALMAFRGTAISYLEIKGARDFRFDDAANTLQADLYLTITS